MPLFSMGITAVNQLIGVATSQTEHENVKVCRDFLNGTEKSWNACILCIYTVECVMSKMEQIWTKLDNFQTKYDRNLDLSLSLTVVFVIFHQYG